MASASDVEIIIDPDRCTRIVDQLSKYDFIAMDAEGVNLGKEGPLTLLQIGTVDDKVYLFDIESNKDLFRKGHLEDLLQSEETVKVIHSCAGDSAALYHQFGITLKNVFDTQVAHLVIEESRGRRLPSSIKLCDICRRYGDKPEPLEQKDRLMIKWTKEDGELWTNRPLTAEMIEYASNDVTALIPSVYQNQKRNLTENNLFIDFQKRVDDEINYNNDKATFKRRQTRMDGIVESIISDIERKYERNITFGDLIDEDEINAIHHIKYDPKEMSPFIKQLKTEEMKARLKEVSDQLSTEGSSFLPKGQSYGFLRFYQKHQDENIQLEAKRLQKALDTIFLADIVKKYSMTTKIGVIKTYEKEALSCIRPRSKDDRSIKSIHLSLYWQKLEKDIDSEIEQLESKGRDYSIPQGKYNWLQSNCRDNVPNGIKMKAKRHIANLDITFGTGNYSA